MNTDSIDEFFDELRSQCFEVIDFVISSVNLPQSYGEYSRNVEALCRRSHTEQEILTNHLYDSLSTKYNYFHNMMIEDQSLENYVKIISQWEHILRILALLFNYLDRTYLYSHRSKSQIRKFGAELLVNDEQITNRLFKLFMDAVTKYRNDRSKTDLLIPTGSIIRRFYSSSSFMKTTYLNKLVLPTVPIDKTEIKHGKFYLQYVLTEIDYEIQFLNKCGFDKETRNKAFHKLRWQYIFSEFTDVIQGNLSYLLLPQNSRELELILDYCEDVEKLDTINLLSQFAYQWKLYLDNKLQMVDSENSLGLITKLLDFYNTYQLMVASSFRGIPLFQAELKNSLKDYIRKKDFNSIILSQLSKYCDAYFRNVYNRRKQDITFKDFKQNVLNIFYSITNKSEFIIYYKLDLSRRLLNSKDINLNDETELIEGFSKLIGENDEGITSLNKMIADIIMSNEELNIVKDGISFNCLVLDKSVWPTVPPSELQIELPESLQSFIDDIKNHPKIDRKLLHWNYYNFYQIIIKTQFNDKDKELSVNLFQALVLLAFNDHEILNIDDLCRITRIENKSIMKRIVNSLSTDRYKLLNQINDKYIVNDSFTDKSSRIRIPYVKEKESIPRNLTTKSSIEDDTEAEELISQRRQTAYKSTLVRLMKQHTQLKVVELFNQCIEILEVKGPVTIQDLKNGLEALINADYIRRIDQDSVEYIP
ncbi:uncharacterized protein RJT21DRAFT_120469 [Scheffersomyces amazonensis]|uniref:uncharacterized protein n=1 Tax=Scheffersomyces amazonensis TaxID=1078765 RepID=UPI00315D93D2